jgi:hypothetical protein
MFLSDAYLAFWAVLRLLVSGRSTRFAKDVELLGNSCVASGRNPRRSPGRPAADDFPRTVSSWATSSGVDRGRSAPPPLSTRPMTISVARRQAQRTNTMLGSGVMLGLRARQAQRPDRLDHVRDPGKSGDRHGALVVSSPRLGHVHSHRVELLQSAWLRRLLHFALCSSRGAAVPEEGS